MKENAAREANDVFNRPEIFVEKFDGPERDEWQKPDEVIKSFNLVEDATVAEIGAGTGYFAVRLAEQVKNVQIICFEQSPKMAAYLGKRVKELGLSNVDVRMDGSDGVLTLEKKADLIFSVDVYHHIQDRVGFFTQAAQALSPEGRVVIIDRTEERVEGHPTGHRIPADTVKEEMRVAGLELAEEFDFLLPVQYYLSFKHVS